MWESGDITPNIINLNTKWRGLVRFTLRLLYPQGTALLPTLPTEKKTWLAPKHTWTLLEKSRIILSYRESNIFSYVQPKAYSLYRLGALGLPCDTVYQKFNNRLIKFNGRCGETLLSACKTTHGVTTLKATFWTVSDMENLKSDKVFCSHSGVFTLC